MKWLIPSLTIALVSCGDPEPEPPADYAEAMEAQGLRVQTGVMTDFLIEDCQELERCFGNNATTPYLLISVPGHPDSPDALPPSTIGEIPKVPSDMAASYYLEKDEAIVLIGETPPPSNYFAFAPYVYTRVDNDGDRIPIFASTQDSLNHLEIGVDGDSAFNSQTAIIVSSDAGTVDSVREALVSTGFSSDAINTMTFPRDTLRFGQGEDADTFLVMGRIALADDPEAYQTYMDSLPMEVFRVTSDTVGEALPLPERKPRGDGTTEDALKDSFDALEDAIIAAAGETPTESINIASSKTVAQIIDPEACIENVTECKGDNRDTTYAAGPLSVIQSGAPLKLDENDVFYVFGVNHAAAGKATYSNFSVYTADKRIGVAAVNSLEMPGSAEVFLPDDPNASQLFVTQIRRDCSDQNHCLELSTDFPGAALDQDLFFIFRAYINPGKTISPGHDEILTERVILVKNP